jgi:hypothetical protein
MNQHLSTFRPQTIFGQLKRIIQQQQEFLNNFSQKSNLNHKYLKINNGLE